MNVSEINIYLGIVTVSLAIGFFLIYQACNILSKKNHKLKQDIKEKDKLIILLTQEVQSSIATLNSLPNRKEVYLSDKTKKLLNLAVSNGNEYEAAAAAKEVCRRLHSKGL